ncbi:MAG: hypothetical protein M5U07_07835 [Xanthobacteraceae bacterium]|nr:hypothetical protein [Xanthobacteraceae bacterium]PWB66613.1 MAG: hypothetical protein C3F17_01165 [Bradyrhizobiaceae bacterium]
MNHSLVTADRTTHLKIVVVALIAAIVVVGVGVTSHVSNSDSQTAGLEARGPVIKAGKPVAITRRDDAAIR